MLQYQVILYTQILLNLTYDFLITIMSMICISSRLMCRLCCRGFLGRGRLGRVGSRLGWRRGWWGCWRWRWTVLWGGLRGFCRTRRGSTWKILWWSLCRNILIWIDPIRMVCRICQAYNLLSIEHWTISYWIGSSFILLSSSFD